jgi:hypothetical protein
MHEKFSCEEDFGLQDSQLHISGSWPQPIQDTDSDYNTEYDSGLKPGYDHHTEYSYDHDFDLECIGGKAFEDYFNPNHKFPAETLPIALPFSIQIDIVLALITHRSLR